MDSKVEERVLKIKRAITDAQEERWIGPIEVDTVAGTLLNEAEILLNEIRFKDAKVLDIIKRISRAESTFDKINAIRQPRSSLYGLAWFEEIPGEDELLDVQKVYTESNVFVSEEIPVEPLTKLERHKGFTDLVQLCSVVIRYLECESLLRKDRILVQRIADLLGVTVKIVSCFGRMQINAARCLQHASFVIDSLHSSHTINEPTTGLKIISSADFQECIQSWESSVKSFVTLFYKLKENLTVVSRSGTMPIAEMDNALLEEVEEWNAPEDLNLTVSDNKGFSRTVASHIFTYKIISTKLETFLKKSTLKQPVLFVGMERSKSVRHCGQEGGFANVYIVELIESLKLPPINVLTINGDKKEEFWCVNKVAVKIAKMDMTYTENAICVRVAREIRVWNTLRHENVLPLFGLWKGFKVEGQVVEYSAPVSPYFEDGDLQHHITNRNLSLIQRLSFLRDISGALAYMHSFDPEVVHGDLRAVNVLVRRRRAYLCDFGLSHLRDGVFGFTTKAHGCERWLAPEHLDKTTKPTPEGDIYSFGSIMLEVLSGEIPWASEESDTALTLLRAKNRREIAPRPSNINNDSHWNVIRLCWKFSPELRPLAEFVRNSVEQLMKELCFPPAVSVNVTEKLKPTTVLSGIQIQGELTFRDCSENDSR